MTCKTLRKTTVARATALSLMLTLTLAGCGEVRRALGYDKAPPDEFTVVSRAPLSQPPDFELRPPQPGVPRPQEGSTRDQAKTALLAGAGLHVAPPTAASGLTAAPAAAVSPPTGSTGERSLLTKAGADHANPDIRRQINEESANLLIVDNGFADKILFWREKPPPGEPIDATKEAKRLADNAATGKSPADGDTPRITYRKDKGWLEDIF